MTDDGFSQKQTEEMTQIVTRIVGNLLDVKVTPQLVELRRVIAVVDKKVDALAAKDQEDSNAITEVVVDLSDRVTTLEGFHGIKHESIEA